MGQSDAEFRALVDGMMQQLSYQNQHLSVISEKLSSGVMNNVLQSGTFIIDASGQYSVSWQATCGCAELFNFSTDTTMILVPQQTSLVPTAGIGVHKFPFGTRRTVNVFSRSLTVFGKPGDTFGLQAFTTGFQP